MELLIQIVGGVILPVLHLKLRRYLQTLLDVLNLKVSVRFIFLSSDLKRNAYKYCHRILSRRWSKLLVSSPLYTSHTSSTRLYGKINERRDRR